MLSMQQLQRPFASELLTCSRECFASLMLKQVADTSVKVLE